MKLHEFTDRLYTMGGIEQDNKNRKLNESYNENAKDILTRVALDTFDDVEVIGFEEKDTKYDTFWKITLKFNDDGIVVPVVFNDDIDDLNNLSDLALHLEHTVEMTYSELEDGEWKSGEPTYNTFFTPFDESLTEARNPENDEVNAVLRKWANSDRNRLSKRDQKILDDNNIKLEPYYPGAKEKIAMSKDQERLPSGVFKHGLGKEHIRRMHPDHDIANDAKTDRDMYIGSHPYNRNKNSWDYDDHQPNKETSDEAKALRPYSREYKNLKGSVEYAKEHNWHKEEAQKKLDDFRAKMAARKNESFNLNESKEGLKDWFWSMIEDNELDTETATGILLTYISDEDLLDAIEEVEEYLES